MDLMWVEERAGVDWPLLSDLLLSHTAPESKARNMANIEIVRAVRFSGRAYLAGSAQDAAALEENLDSKTKKHLLDIGAIIPTRGTVDLSEEEDDEEEDDDEELDALFPCKLLLTLNGFKTKKAVRSASDDELLSIDGIGPSKLEDIRAALS